MEDAGADLDALLRLIGEDDSGEVNFKNGSGNRSVDEILRNHASPSPSPPASPPSSSSTHRYLRHSVKAADTDHESLASDRDHDRRTSVSVPTKRSVGINQSGTALPLLFGGGIVTSAKPGAALAAAFAASRAVPTPHATAIKTRRASIPVTQRSTFESKEDVVSNGSSQLSTPDVDYDVSVSGLDSGTISDGSYIAPIKDAKLREGKEPTLVPFYPNVESRKDFDTDGSYSSEHIHLKKSEEVAEVTFQASTSLRVEEDDIQSVEKIEGSRPAYGHSHDASSIVSLKDNVQDGMEMELEDLPTLDEGIKDYHEASSSSEHRNTNGPSSGATYFDYDEGIDGGEELSNVGSQQKNDSSLQLKSDSFLKPLDLAEDIEKKQASTGMHYEKGAAALPMRLEGVQIRSSAQGFFDVNSRNAVTRTISAQAFQRDNGSPKVLAVHYSCIAVGMSKGSIVIFPCKGNDHQIDITDARMNSLGLQGDRSNVPVTSLRFNLQGDLLFSGYGDGHCTVWDIQKASALKVVTEHRAPIIHLLHLGSGREFNLLSGDTKGVVKLLQFSVSPWLNRISHTKTLKLLDESTSQVVCASPLLHDDENVGVPSRNSSDASASASSTTGSMINDGSVVLVTRQSALVAKVSPSVEVYTQLPKPSGVAEGVLPYVAWKCVSQPSYSPSENASTEISETVSLLAIAWDQTIQVVKLNNFKVKELKNLTTEHGVMCLTWLRDQILAVITLTGLLYLYTRDGILIHETRFSVEEFQGNDIISCHRYFADSFGNPVKAYHNSISVRGATIYLLGHENLIVCRLLSWREQIEVLWKAGDWEGALNTGIAIYDGKSHGVIDLPRNLDELQQTVIPYLVELVNLYIQEVFSYISMASRSQNPMLEQSDDIKDQYVHAGGVAVEFCLHIKKTDILFDHIMSKFVDSQQKVCGGISSHGFTGKFNVFLVETFLEILEPYILKDMLGSLPPAIMQSLVEYYSRRGWLQRIEQCILHMDILSLDFNQVILLCREHGLHCALIYLFSKGLDDFRTPLEELMTVLQNSPIEDATPLGHGNISPIRLPSLRRELLSFLLDDSSAKNPHPATSLPSHNCNANLLYLLKLDTEATLEVLKCAFTDVPTPNSADATQASNDFKEELAESQNLVQKVVDILCGIVATPAPTRDFNFVEVWPSKKDRAHIYDFTAYYVVCERANISKAMLTQILEYLTEEVARWDALSAEEVEVFNRREKQLLSLLYALPVPIWEVDYLFPLAEKAQFHQICGYIHAVNHQDVAAMDSYMKVIHEPIHTFFFIHDRLGTLSGDDYDAFELAVISHFPGLVKLSRECSYLLIIHHFLGMYREILSKLQHQPESLFLFLKTVIEFHRTGTLNLSCLEKVEHFPPTGARGAQTQSGGVQAYLDFVTSSRKLMLNNQINLTDEQMQQYFVLLCQYDRESVLHYLETSESYNLEHCLRLCKEYGIVDAASYLLERAGDVGSALLLNLSSLGPKFVMLENEIHKDCSDGVKANLNAILKKKTVAEIHGIMHLCIGLCKRNSSRLKEEESSSLWFQLLDFFFEPLSGSLNSTTIFKGEEIKKYIDTSVSKLIDEEGQKFRWSFSLSPRRPPIMRKLFTMFIKEIVEGMIGYVQLPRIMLKLLSVGNQQFGDVKHIILVLLGTYDFERRILDTAKSLIDDDTYYIMSLLRKRASHGYAPRSFVCCICNSVTAKSSEFQLFGCSHAVHLNCNTGLGCPVCLSQKKDHGSSSRPLDDGLVNKFASVSKQVSSVQSSYYPDRESFENSHGVPAPSTISLLQKLEKDHNAADIENMPQLRLAPPALYHDKVKKGVDILSGKQIASSSQRQPGKSKSKESSDRAVLKSRILSKWSGF